MENLNRRQRRDLEKRLGLFKEYRKMKPEDRNAVRTRKMKTGKEIHLRNTQEIENSIIQQEAELSAKKMQSWIAAGKTPEEAQELLKLEN